MKRKPGNNMDLREQDVTYKILGLIIDFTSAVKNTVYPPKSKSDYINDAIRKTLKDFPQAETYIIERH